MSEVTDNNTNQNDSLNKYEEYINKTIGIFKNILDKLNIIHTSLKIEINNKLNDLIEKYPLNKDDLIHIDNIANIIYEEFDIFNKYISNNSNKDNENNNNNSDNKIENKNLFEFKEEHEIIPNSTIPQENILNNNDEKKKDEYKNEINITYFVKNKGTYNIFGEKFVKNNKDNISLIINGAQNQLVNKCQLNKGENTVRIIIKNKLTNISHIFSSCKYLKNINELKYLDVTEVNDFSFIFNECSSLSNIKPLEK